MRCSTRSVITFAAAAGLVVPLAGCVTSNAGPDPRTAAVLAMDKAANRPTYGRILDTTPNEEVAGEVIRAFEAYRWDEDKRDDLVVRDNGQ